MAKKYTGKALEESKKISITPPGGKSYIKSLHPYLPDPELVNAVNLAAQLRRPLLLMGDPGCGKSILAEALAYEWHEEDFYKYYFEWNIKSNTKAQDGIYTHDPIARLRQTEVGDGELDGKGLIQKERAYGSDKKGLTDFYIRQGYIEEGPLKKAIDTAAELLREKVEDENKEERNPPVLLIDEIDKASIDFPNDLLLELDKFSYYIKETAYRSDARKKEQRPFVVITSNNEKELPPAFLRRCVYHYISFPKEKKLRKILAKRNGISEDDKLLEVATGLFMLIRKRLSEGLSNKTVSTAELIDWFEGLRAKQAAETATEPKVLTRIEEAISAFPAGPIEFPLYQAVLKNWDALVRILKKDVYDPSE